MRVAVYAGSFDPVTLGHVDVIARASGLFDRVVVAVGQNPAKRYRFDAARRCELVRQACAEVPNVEVASFEGLLVDAVRRLGGTVIVRGLRSVSDFDSEQRYGLANRDLSGLESVFLLASPEHLYVSSTLVKEVHDNGGDVSRLVPPVVAEALRSGR